MGKASASECDPDTWFYRLSKERGLLAAVAPKIDSLRREGFYLREEHYRMILKSGSEL